MVCLGLSKLNGQEKALVSRVGQGGQGPRKTLEEQEEKQKLAAPLDPENTLRTIPTLLGQDIVRQARALHDTVAPAGPRASLRNEQRSKDWGIFRGER